MRELILDKNDVLCYTMLTLGSSRRFCERDKVNIMKHKFLALYEMTRLMKQGQSLF